MRHPRLCSPICLVVVAWLGSFAPNASAGEDRMPLRFDFGPRKQALARGFRGITGRDVYTPTRGFGWRTAWGVEFARPQQGNALTADGICARDHVDRNPKENDVTFRAHVRNGVYAVTVWVGDLAKNEGRKGICVATNGRVALPAPGVGGWGRATERTLPAVVENGALDVNLFVSGEGGAYRLSVLGMKIERVVDAEREAALRTKWRQESPPRSAAPRALTVGERTLREVGRRHEIPLGSLPAAWQGRALLTYGRSNPGDLLSYSIPRQEELTNGIAAFAVPDDDQPLYFGVYAVRRLDDVRVHCSDLTSATGRIHASNVEIRTLTSRPRTLSNQPGRTAKIVCDLLERNIPFSVPAGASQGLYLRVRVPKGQPAGLYTGRLLLSPARVPPVAVTVKLRVLPLSLSRPEDRVWHLYSDSLRWVNMSRSAWRREIEDMFRHGINSLSVSYPPIAGSYIERDGKLVDADLGVVEDCLRYAAELGMDGPVMIAATPGILWRFRGWGVGHRGRGSHGFTPGQVGRALRIEHETDRDHTEMGQAAGTIFRTGESVRLEVRYKFVGKGSANVRLTFMKSYKRHPVPEGRINSRLTAGDRWRTFSAVSRVPDNAPFARVTMDYGGGPGLLSIDEVRLLGRDGVVNHIVNPGFERDFGRVDTVQGEWPRGFMADYVDAIKAIGRAVERTGLQPWIEGTDEAGNNPKSEDRELNEMRGARRSGLPTWCNLSTAAVEKMGHTLDGVCHYVSLLGGEESCAKLLAHYHETKRRLYFISSGCYVGQEVDWMPNRHGVGLFFWKSGCDGTGIWTFQRPIADPLNDFDGKYKDYCLVFPPRKEGGDPVPTLGWEGIREGWKDFKYVHALERAVAQAERDGRKTAAARGRTVLEFIRNAVPWYDRRTDVAYDNASADRLRWLAAWTVMEIQRPDAARRRIRTRTVREPALHIDFAEGRPPRPLKPLICPVTAKPPALDGRLDDATWKNALKVSGFHNYREPTMPAQQETELYLCHDARNFYIGLRCFEPAVDQLKCTAEAHDGNVFVDDSIEVFLDTQNDEFRFYQLCFNAAGVRFDMRCMGGHSLGANVFAVDYEKRKVRDLTWNGKWDVRTSRHADRWEAEVQIPFATVGRDSDMWGVNVGRNRNAGERETSALKAIGLFHQPGQFAKMLLAGARTDGARIEEATFPPVLHGRASARLRIAGLAEARARTTSWAATKELKRFRASITPDGIAEFPCALNQRVARLTFQMEDTQGELAYRVHIPTTVAPALAIKSARRLLFPDDPTGRFRIALQVSDEERAALKMSCQLLASDRRLLKSIVTPIRGTTATLSLSMAHSHEGFYALALALVDAQGDAMLGEDVALVLAPHFLSSDH